ncbi:hypothetical protein TNCV_4116671 [Trichonephila clavipes]|nr:hypothetical protein TNCV_4116671 [Trichonephila clavipes]
MFGAFAARVYSKYRRAASPLVKLIEGKERWELPGRPPMCVPSKLGRTEPNRIVTGMVLKATSNNRRKSLALCRDEFHIPRSDTASQEVLELLISLDSDESDVVQELCYHQIPVN